MAMKRFHMREVCYQGDDWHYIRWTVDAEEAPTTTTPCDDHPDNPIRDLVVEKSEDIA